MATEKNLFFSPKQTETEPPAVQTEADIEAKIKADVQEAAESSNTEPESREQYVRDRNAASLNEAADAIAAAMKTPRVTPGMVSTAHSPRANTPHSSTAYELAKRHGQLQGHTDSHRPLNLVEAEAREKAKQKPSPDLCVGGSGLCCVYYKPLNMRLQFRNRREAQKALKVIAAIVADVAGHEAAQRLSEAHPPE